MNRLYMRIGFLLGLSSTAAAALAADADRMDVVGADARIVRAASAAELAAALGATSAKPAGLYMPSDDPTVKMKVGGFMQARYYALNRGTTATTSTGFMHGFINARTRVNLEGSPGVKDLTYKFEVNADPSTGLFAMTDAYIKGVIAPGWTIIGGQFKPGFSHEQSVADTRQLAVERSTFDSLFALTRVRGVTVEYVGDAFGASGTFSNGSRTVNQQILNKNKADAAVSARVEYKPKGAWDQYKQLVSFRDAEPIVVVGLGAHAQWGGQTNFTQDVDFQMVTADAFFGGSGWNVYAAALWRHTDNNVTNKDLDDGGLLAQAGYFVTDTVEPFLRYEHIFIDGDYGAATKDMGIIAPGVNYYLVPHSHAAKLTVDALVTLGSQAESAGLIGASTLVGIQAGNADPQLVLRVQMQVVF